MKFAPSKEEIYEIRQLEMNEINTRQNNLYNSQYYYPGERVLLEEQGLSPGNYEIEHAQAGATHINIKEGNVAPRGYKHGRRSGKIEITTSNA